MTFSVVVAVILASSVIAQPIPVGSEFQVNGYTTNNQSYPSLAADAQGDFVVVWQSIQGGSQGEVFARLFSSSGTALAAEFQVNSFAPDGQSHPSVAAEGNGDFVVAWTDDDRDGNVAGVFGRRFSSDGTALGNDFQVNTYTSDAQFGVSAASDADGDFVLAWTSYLQDGNTYGVFARRFSSSGAALAAEFQVNTQTFASQGLPAVASEPDGDFVVVWESSVQDGGVSGVFARRFSSAGAALASEFQVNVYETGNQEDPAVAVDADGDFVVAWESIHDGDGDGIFARRFSSAGAPLSGDFPVNTYTPDDQVSPFVRCDRDGDFVVSWFSIDQDGNGDGIFARAFSSAGLHLDSEFQINSYTQGGQRNPILAGSGSAFVVAWQSGLQDGSMFGIFAQRFKVPITLDVDGNGVVQPLADLLLGLRYSFGFRGATLITGAVGAGCTRCDAPSIEAYLAALSE